MIHFLPDVDDIWLAVIFGFSTLVRELRQLVSVDCDDHKGFMIIYIGSPLYGPSAISNKSSSFAQAGVLIIMFVPGRSGCQIYVPFGLAM